MFSRSIYLLICSLVLAGIVHITIVLLIPLFSKQDVAKKIKENWKDQVFEIGCVLTIIGVVMCFLIGVYHVISFIF